jgi:serine protease
MMETPRVRVLRAPALVAGVCVLAVVTMASRPGRAFYQDARHGGRRILVQPIAPPAIDVGVSHESTAPNGLTSATLAGSEPVRAYATVPGRMIVKFRPEASATERAQVLASAQAIAHEQPSDANFEVVTIAKDVDPNEAVQRVSAAGGVEYAQATHYVLPLNVPNDPLFYLQWNFKALDMERVWDMNPGASSSIIVAVIDSGLAYRSAIVRYNARAFQVQNANGSLTPFPALGAIDVPFAPAPDLIGADRIVAPHDFIWDDDMPLDLDGHGTHVTGTIGQLTNNGVGVTGMAFNVRIMPIKAAATNWDMVFGAPNFGTEDSVARAIRYAVDHGARVINMSLAVFGPPIPVIEDALRYAVGKGAFVSIGAGNFAEAGNPISRLAELAPRIDGVVAVGAVGPDLKRAFYSSFGPYVELAAPGGNQRDFQAEGGVYQQTYNQALANTYLQPSGAFKAPRFDVFMYTPFQGTSAAAPHVAALAALLMQQGLTKPAAIESAMKRFATDLGPAGRDDEYGYGLINPRATLRGLGFAK